MRGDPGRPRGEAARVAARVRDLLREHEARSVGDTFLGGLAARHEAGGRSGRPETFRAADGDGFDGDGLEGDGLDGDGFDGDAFDGDGLEGDELDGLGGADRADPVGGPPGARHSASAPGRAGRSAAPRLPLALRLDPGRRTAMVAGGVVALVAVLIGAWLIASRPRSVPVSAVSHAGSPAPAGSVSAPAGSSGRGAPSASAAPVVVDVAGKVRRPGLYRLPAGSRVDDAIRAAGGAKHGVDLSPLNLAAKLVDGQQIAVGTTGAPAGGGGAAVSAASGGGSGGAGAPVDLNTASLTELETLPGVGPVLGQHILDYRTQHGSFGSVDDLRNVSGIGDVRFTQLRPLVTV